MSVSLQKGQKISLDKEAGGALSRIVMGLGWDAIKKKGLFGFGSKSESVDLDASCLMFDEAGKAVDFVWFRQLKSRDGSIVHTGDNRTGAGDGDDEQIEVDLTKVPAQIKSLIFTVNSFTGQNFSQVENGYCRIVKGLGWDAIKTKGLFGFGSKTESVDLDASCLMFDEAGKTVDTVWFRQLKSKDGSIVHTGDNRTGAGDGDDEQIEVDLSRIPSQVKSLIFTVNSFTGQNFSQVENAYCRIVNAADQKEVARYDLSVQGAHTAQIMAKLYRHNGEWKMHAIGENGSGRTFDDLMPKITPHL